MIAAATTGAAALFVHALVLRHRIVLQDFALEDPDLDSAGSVGRIRRGRAIIHIRAQRVQRHTTFAIPFETRDFSATQATRAVDADALGAQTHGRLNGPLHGATEGHTTLELLGNRIRDQRGVDFRLADLDDVDRHFRIGHLADDLAELLDVRALLADHDARTSRMDRDAALLVRTLDDDAAKRQPASAAS